MPLTMTKEMHDIRHKGFMHEPKNHEDRLKYAHATLRNIIINHREYFNYYFLNKQTDLIEFFKWMDKKDKGEPYTENEMLGLRVLNGCQFQYISIAMFKELALGIFDKDQFCEDLGLPNDYKAEFDDEDDIPDLKEIDSDSDDE